MTTPLPGTPPMSPSLWALILISLTTHQLVFYVGLLIF